MVSEARERYARWIYGDPRKPLDARILLSGFIRLVNGDDVGCLNIGLDC